MITRCFVFQKPYLYPCAIQTFNLHYIQCRKILFDRKMNYLTILGFKRTDLDSAMYWWYSITLYNYSSGSQIFLLFWSKLFRILGKSKLTVFRPSTWQSQAMIPESSVAALCLGLSFVRAFNPLYTANCYYNVTLTNNKHTF